MADTTVQFGHISIASREGGVRRTSGLAHAVFGFGAWSACFALAGAMQHRATRLRAPLAPQNQGPLKVSPTGMAWRSSAGGKVVEIKKDSECSALRTRPPHPHAPIASHAC
jgi:hypothetical protein